jgi:uncharacterized membrane protein
MNGVHFHLILNHIPILGSIFGLVLIGYGLFFKNNTISIAGLVTIVIVGLFTIPAFLTGEQAEHAVEKMIGVSQSAIEEHEEQAEIAYWLMLMCGAIALGTLLSAKATQKLSPPLLWINLVMLLIVAVLMARVGYSGGTIHHPEINAGQPQQQLNNNEDD